MCGTLHKWIAWYSVMNSTTCTLYHFLCNGLGFFTGIAKLFRHTCAMVTMVWCALQWCCECATYNQCRLSMKVVENYIKHSKLEVTMEQEAVVALGRDALYNHFLPHPPHAHAHAHAHAHISLSARFLLIQVTRYIPVARVDIPLRICNTIPSLSVWFTILHHCTLTMTITYCFTSACSHSAIS
jgi:hypothetical protein